MTLDEILDEAERLEREYQRAVDDGYDASAHHADEMLALHYATHGPRLVAALRAAVEMREGVEKSMARANGRWCEWGERAVMVRTMLEENLAAFDALASGGEEGK